MVQKVVTNGITPNQSKVLVSLEDFTCKRGSDLLQNLYLVAFGYNLENLNHLDSENWDHNVSAKEHTKVVNLIIDYREKLIEETRKLVIAENDLKSKIKKISTEEAEEGKKLEADIKKLASIIEKKLKEIKELGRDREEIEGILENRIKNDDKITVKTFRSSNIIKPHDAKCFQINLDNRTRNSQGRDDHSQVDYFNYSTDFFFAWHTPVSQIERGRTYTFPHGCPIFYGKPRIETSIYFAVLEISNDYLPDELSAEKDNKIEPNENGNTRGDTEMQGEERSKPDDNKATSEEATESNNSNSIDQEKKKACAELRERKRLRKYRNTPNGQLEILKYIINNRFKTDAEIKKATETAISSFQEIDYLLDLEQVKVDESPLVKQHRRKRIEDILGESKEHFGLLIKKFETKALECKHKIRYTNVFTFREEDDWMEGGHKDWGDHRLDMTMRIQVAD